MRCLPICVAALAGTAVYAQSNTFEPENFNVTEALAKLGVNVSALPGLEPLSRRSSLAACSIACSSLQLLYGSNQVFAANTSSYTTFVDSYWSKQQEEVSPYCIFQPKLNVEVSVGVLLARLTQCPFAVKSGGHAAFAGASSIQGGVTLSLVNFNQTVPSADKSSVSVGPGNRWLQVYETLQPENIVVIGGRVSSIGVGGLTLGGGISWFSNTFGWACDNVNNYEVVTASGVIINVSLQTYPDLYWALRGGGNNFGIVTSFDLAPIPLPGGMMWGGSRISLNFTYPALIEAFYNLGTTGASTQPNSSQILSFTYYQGTPLASAALIYAQPVANASVFAEYLAIPAIKDTTSVRTLANLTNEFAEANPDGLRETYWAAVYKLTPEMTTFVKDTFYAELPSIVNAASLVPAATLQVITLGELTAMQKNGGNALGIYPSDGPLLLLNMNVQWSNEADDDRILEFNNRIVTKTIAYAQANGFYNQYLYMNYASQFQNVVGSYGSANQANLTRIAKKYDPTGVFQTLVPGGFKLAGAPASTVP